MFAEVQWSFAPAFSATLGVRSSEVRYESEDHYITAANPDDSGSRKFTNTSPILGLVYHATPELNLYASYGQGFETPTLAEMAYNTVGPGLNFALNPATSQAVEIGLKAIIARRHRLNVAAFYIDTEDEIVIDTAVRRPQHVQERRQHATRRGGIAVGWRVAVGIARARRADLDSCRVHPVVHERRTAAAGAVR